MKTLILASSRKSPIKGGKKRFVLAMALLCSVVFKQVNALAVVPVEEMAAALLEEGDPEATNGSDLTIQLSAFPLKPEYDWELLTDTMARVYSLRYGELHWTFDSIVELDVQGRDYYSERSFILHGEHASIEVIVLYKYLADYFWMYPDSTDLEPLEYTAVLNVSSDTSDFLLLGSATIVDKEMESNFFYVPEPREQLTRMYSEFVEQGLQRDTSYFQELDTVLLTDSNTSKFHGLEPGWSIETKNELAIFSHYAYEGVKLRRNTVQPTWNGLPHQCISVIEFESDSVAITLLVLDFSTADCSCAATEDRNICGCMYSEAEGLEPSTGVAIVRPKDGKEAFLLTGCGQF